MCTSFTVNKKNSLVGWNLDILGMEYQVTSDDKGVYIEILDEKEGWLPIFGANSRGDFVGMPTCHPFDDRSDPKDNGETGPVSMLLGIDLLLQKKTFEEVKNIAETSPIYSVPGVTFMSSLTDKDGNVLHIIPGQGYKYYEKPEYVILTNFSPFKGDSEKHPWMGMDRYLKGEEMLKTSEDSFDVKDAFNVLKACSQEVCPTVVSMVFDLDKREVFWCENRRWDEVKSKKFK